MLQIFVIFEELFVNLLTTDQVLYLVLVYSAILPQLLQNGEPLSILGLFLLERV